MGSKTNLSHRDLSSRAIATGVPRTLAESIVQRFEHWCKCSGEEWSISRLKAVKLDMIRMRAGDTPVCSWIAKNGKGNFSGVLGQLRSWMFKHPTNFARGIQLLQIYTSRFSPGVTPQQQKKFVSAVLAHSPERGALDCAQTLVKKGFELAGLRPRLRPLPLAKRLLDMPSSSERRAPTLCWGSVPEDDGILDSLSYLTESWKGWAHYQEYQVFYDPVIGELKKSIMSTVGTFHPLGWDDVRPAGKIGLIQEPGYKLRAVANPGRVFQRVLEPLGDSIYSMIKRLPWDCTFEQSKAFPHLQSALTSGRTVHSIDLSNATDYFPLELQVNVLRTLFPATIEGKSIIDLFESLSQADWEMKDYGWLRWNRGQPLGLYPSFGSFALAHGLLLLGIAQKWDNQFFVLGDDVVILDTQIATKYKDILTQLGCPISDAKSIVSSELSEFGGKLVTRSQIIPQLKWRNVSDDSFIDVARLLGPRSLRLMRKRQQKIILELSEVPEIFGGLGWNPKGKPLEERLNSPWIFDDSYKPQPRVTSLSRMRCHRLMTSNLVQLAAEIRRKACLPAEYSLPADEVDQTSLALCQMYLPRLAPWYLLMGKNLDWVFEALDQDLDLPIRDEGGSTRSSALERWERVLNSTSYKA